MVSGLPVVACAECCGRIVRRFESILTKSRAAAAVDLLMSLSDERARLASRASEVLARYSFDHVLGLWEKVISRSVSQNGLRRLELNTRI